MTMNIGARILPLLEKRGMTQRDLAYKIGASEVSISRYISGQRMPKANIVVYIADALNTTTDYLLGRTDNDTGTGDKADRRPSGMWRDR